MPSKNAIGGGELSPGGAPAGIGGLLSNPVCQLYFSTQFMSMIGNWMTVVAQAWLIYQLSGSAWLLGVAAFASQIPTFFLSLFGGIIADRLDRRRAFLLLQLLSMSASATLAGITFLGEASPRAILLLALIKGIVSALDLPVRQSMMTAFAGRQFLREAVALNSGIYNLARIAGPALAGGLIARFGTGACFLTDAVSYLFVIVAVFFTPAPPRPEVRVISPKSAVVEAIAFAWARKPIRWTLILAAFASVFALSFLSQLPAFAEQVLGLGSIGLGHLYAVVGVGALIGAALLSRISSRLLFRVPSIACAAIALTLLGLRTTADPAIAEALVGALSFCLMVLSGAANSFIQHSASDHMRGRLIALYSTMFLGFYPWGSLLIGALVQIAGMKTGIVACSLGCAAGALLHLCATRNLDETDMEFSIQCGDG